MTNVFQNELTELVDFVGFVASEAGSSTIPSKVFEAIIKNDSLLAEVKCGLRAANYDYAHSIAFSYAAYCEVMAQASIVRHKQHEALRASVRDRLRLVSKVTP